MMADRPLPRQEDPLSSSEPMWSSTQNIRGLTADNGSNLTIIQGQNINTSWGDKRPETPPTPSSNVPFRRDIDFVDRKPVIDKIRQKCAVPGSWTALVGLGGVGKSQLAIEYAYRNRERWPKTWVFWVHASNAARFEQSYRDIADCVKIPERQTSKVNIFKLVYDWLRDSKAQWLIILDNVDDTRFLLESHQGDSSSTSKPLREYIPQSQNGSILITTRSRETALKLVEHGDIITIAPMDEAHALALFRKKCPGQDDSNDVTELVAALEFMPLAIVQAAAYISKRAPRCSVRQYLTNFQRNDRNKTTLLDYEGGQLRRDREAKNSILITWQISFDLIREIRPSAADLLSLMSFFDRQGIPDVLLRSRGEQRDSQQEYEKDDDGDDDDDEDASQSSLDDGFENDILILRDYSFISIDTDGKTFEMHRLIQLATRVWLEAHDQQEKWKQQFIKNLDASFPTGDYENWVTCQSLFLHTQSALAQKPKEQDSLIKWASVLHKAAWYAERIGKWEEAEKMSVQAMKVREKILGQEDKDTLWSMEMVGQVYISRGKWKAAEDLFVQVMEVCKTKLGAYHLVTLISMGNLASIYWNQRRLDAAEELQVQVMEVYKTKLGADHPYTLTSIANLALTYRNQGRLDTAEELQVQVMEVYKTKLGADHPYTLTSIANLALTYRNQGRLDTAEELEVQVMEVSKTKLGADHPDTLTSMANLASTYWKQGLLDAAEELEVHVMETRKTKLGADHPETLTSMANLASTYRKQGRDIEAISLLRECVRLRERILGTNHPHFISSSKHLNDWMGEESATEILAGEGKKS